MSFTRRVFLRSSAVVGAVGLPMYLSSRAQGANDEIRIAVVGCGGRSKTHFEEFGKIKGVRIVAVCDPDRVRLTEAATLIEKRFQYRPDEVVDVRKLMERKDLDAISVATMQYWHSLPTIWACQTGRDVYVEKPLAHYIWEGRQMVNAARKHKRIVQVGLQGSSRETDRLTTEYIKSGQLGKIRYVVCFADKTRKSIGKRTEPLPIPETLDYDLWCGPARKEPLYRDQVQYDCGYDWSTGDGESCNQGTHEIDIARRLLGETGLPRRVMSVGGRFVFNDAGNAPNTQIAYYDFPTAPVLYELHNLAPKNGTRALPFYQGKGRADVCVQCEGGYVMMHDGSVWDNQGTKIKQFTGGDDHFGNFIRAMRSRNINELTADILPGHWATNVCHAGNISYRLGKKASATAIREQIGDMPAFQQIFDRYLTHIGAYGVGPDESVLGPWLECDRDNECFKDNEEANVLVKGFYREPYLVPEIEAETT